VTTVCYLSEFLHFDKSLFFIIFSIRNQHDRHCFTKTQRRSFFKNRKHTYLYISMKYSVKYILIEMFLFLHLFSFTTLSLYIILGHSEIFLAVPSPSDDTNITNTSPSLTTLKLYALRHIHISPYYLQQMRFRMRNNYVHIRRY